MEPMIPRIPAPSRRTARAFSLLELLLVMVVLGILLAVTAPAIIAPLRGSTLNQAGQLIGDQIALARQEALTRNREVQVRFYYWATGPEAGWRAVQIWRVETTDSDVTEVPAGRLRKLPAGVVISDNPSLSPLLDADPHVKGDAKIGDDAVTYAGFRFLPGGRTSSTVVATNNFLTAQPIADDPAAPKNFYTLQVDPLTGKVSVFRP